MKATKKSVVITPAVAEVRETIITLEMSEEEAHKLLCLLGSQSCSSGAEEYVPGWDELIGLLIPDQRDGVIQKLKYEVGTNNFAGWEHLSNWKLRKRAAR